MSHTNSVMSCSILVAVSLGDRDVHSDGLHHRRAPAQKLYWRLSLCTLHKVLYLFFSFDPCTMWVPWCHGCPFPSECKFYCKANGTNTLVCTQECAETVAMTAGATQNAKAFVVRSTIQCHGHIRTLSTHGVCSVFEPKALSKLKELLHDLVWPLNRTRIRFADTACPAVLSRGTSDVHCVLQSVARGARRHRTV